MDIFEIFENLVKFNYNENVDRLFENLNLNLNLNFQIKSKKYCKPLCEHGKRKSYCKICEGSNLCKHDKRKSSCKLCEGSNLCKHGFDKHRCLECGTKYSCHHNRLKYNCNICNNIYCKSPKCSNRSAKKWDGYCPKCYKLN